MSHEWGDGESWEASPEKAAQYRELQGRIAEDMRLAAEQRADNLAAMTMIRAAEAGYKSADTFAGWFIAGTAALVGLLVANLDKVSDFIPASAVREAVPRLVVAFGLVFLAKWLGSLIAAKAAGRQAAVDQMREWEERGMPGVPAQDFLDAQRRACPWWINFMRDLGPKTSLELSRRILTQVSLAGFCILGAAGIIGSIWWTLAKSITDPHPQPARSVVVPSLHERPKNEQQLHAMGAGRSQPQRSESQREHSRPLDSEAQKTPEAGRPEFHRR